MVFSGLYPADGSDFEALNHAIERLTCNDASVSVTKESSSALGLGFRCGFLHLLMLGNFFTFPLLLLIFTFDSAFRCGFLGLLHMDVFHQRLEQVLLHYIVLFGEKRSHSSKLCIYHVTVKICECCATFILWVIGTWSSCHFNRSDCPLYF